MEGGAVVRAMTFRAGVMLGIVAGLVALSAGSQMAPAAEKVQRPDTQAPFAIQDVPPDYDPHFNGLGVRWVRLSGAAGAVWDADEPTPGTFEWQRLDSIIGGYSRRGMNMLVTVLSFNRWDRGLPPGANAAVPLPVDLPHNMDAYKSYLRALVLRYPAVRYWQIENEPDGNGWKDTPERFAILVKESYLTIKQANPEARVVLAGAALPEGFYRFYLPMLAALSGMKDAPDSRYFDVADIHWSGQFGGNIESSDLGSPHKASPLVLRQNLGSCQVKADFSLFPGGEVGVNPRHSQAIQLCRSTIAWCRFGNHLRVRSLTGFPFEADKGDPDRGAFNYPRFVTPGRYDASA